MSKITFDSEMYKRVEKNLMLESIPINEKIAMKAIEAVNSRKKITPAMIKEVIQLAK